MSPADPPAPVGIWLTLVPMALAACYLPARCAANVDQMESLKRE